MRTTFVQPRVNLLKAVECYATLSYDHLEVAYSPSTADAHSEIVYAVLIGIWLLFWYCLGTIKSFWHDIRAGLILQVSHSFSNWSGPSNLLCNLSCSIPLFEAVIWPDQLTNAGVPTEKIHKERSLEDLSDIWKVFGRYLEGIWRNPSLVENQWKK